MKQFQDSISFDIHLWDADIRGSIAYAGALAESGVISKAEAAKLVKGLRTVRDEFANGTFVVQPDDEDVHAAVERRLKEIVGEVAQAARRTQPNNRSPPTCGCSASMRLRTLNR